MGSLVDVTDISSVGKSNKPFSFKKDKSFLENPLQINVRFRRSPKTSTFRPLFLQVINSGPRWNESYNDANIFQYYSSSDTWHNYVIIESTNYACKFQLEYFDGSLSEIYGGIEPDIKIPLINKKVKKLIVHSANKAQTFESLYRKDNVIFYEKIIPDEIYSMVICDKTNPDGYIINQVKILKNRYIPRFEMNRFPDTNRTHWYVKYQIKYELNGKIYSCHGFNSSILRDGTKRCFYFVKTKTSKVYGYDELKKKQKIKNIESDRIKLLLEKKYTKFVNSIIPIEKEYSTVKIGKNFWCTELVDNSNTEEKGEKFITINERFKRIVPKGYRIPTLTDWEDLFKYFHKFNSNWRKPIDLSNDNSWLGGHMIYKDENRKLILPLLGSLNGGNFKQSGRNGYYWTNVDNIKMGTYIHPIVELFWNNDCTEIKNNDISPSNGFCMILIKNE